MWHTSFRFVTRSHGHSEATLSLVPQGSRDAIEIPNDFPLANGQLGLESPIAWQASAFDVEEAEVTCSHTEDGHVRHCSDLQMTQVLALDVFRTRPLPTGARKRRRFPGRC